MGRVIHPEIKIGDRYIDYRDADMVMRVREIFDYGKNSAGRWPRRIRQILLEPVGWTEGRHRLIGERTLLLDGHTELVRETPETVAAARGYSAREARRLT